MELLNKAQLTMVFGGNANSGYSPDYAGATSKSSHSSSSASSASNNGRFDPYAGTDDCVIAIGLGALSGLFGGPGAAMLGVVTNGYNACIGSSNNGSGRSSNGGSNCSSGIGGVCN